MVDAGAFAGVSTARAAGAAAAAAAVVARGARGLVVLVVLVVLVALAVVPVEANLAEPGRRSIGEACKDDSGKAEEPFRDEVTLLACRTRVAAGATLFTMELQQAAAAL